MHLLLPQLARGRGEEVAVDDREVGELAGLDRAAAPLLERGERGVEGEAAQGLGEREALRRIPAAGRLAVVVLARHGGVDAEERIHILDGKVAAEGEAG